MKNGKIKIVILAAGQGKRMGGDMPKVLAQVKGKPMIKHLLESVEKSDIKEKPIIVVGYKKDLVINELGDRYHYVHQEELLGTGYAVALTKEHFKNDGEHLMVLYGDQPFTSVKTIQKIQDKHLKSGKKITMATVKVPDFEDWRACFTNFSRVLRNRNGKIVRTVEKKDANEEELKITEINPCYFCFDSKWLFEKLQNLKNDNTQKEYYLTDVIKVATQEGIEIESIEIDAHEALGANTKEELAVLEKFAV